MKGGYKSMMTNTFIFSYDSAFSLSLPPLSIDSSTTGIIDWGDNTTSKYTYGYNNHSYECGGQYTVTYTTTDFNTITGGFCASNSYIKEAYLSEGIETILSGTFYYANNLETIHIPSTAKVDSSSIVNCSHLKYVSFGDYYNSAIDIDNNNINAFNECTSLKSIIYYTNNESLKNTINNSYFILTNGDEPIYIPVEYKTVYTPSPVITDIPKGKYINVYDMVETDFNHNGLRIIYPTSCTITEELNGNYSLTLEHIVDDDGTWLCLKEFNIIKCLGQLFRIYQTSTKLKSDGTAIHTVNAQHIFYDLSHRLIKECCIDGLNGQSALNQIHNSIFNNNQDGYLEYSFRYYSDISNVTQANYSMVSPVACLIGEDGSFVNRLGGELYRDNFYYSICNRKENSLDNAFQITHGVNMLEVEENVDYSNFCTYLHTTDNYGNMYDVSYVKSSSFPHNYSKGVTFNYSENNIDILGVDMHNYFEECWKPRITYTVNFKDLSNSELYKDFIHLNNLNVGDSGTIYCGRLDINTTQKIISKTTDGITGEVISITLSNYSRGLTRFGKYDNTITKSDNIIDKIISPHKKINVTREEWEYLETTGTWHSDWDYNILEEL